jgi:hypothetical protein
MRDWICANMAHMRRQSGVVGVSAIAAHARSERIVGPCIALGNARGTVVGVDLRAARREWRL